MSGALVIVDPPSLGCEACFIACARCGVKGERLRKGRILQGCGQSATARGRRYFLRKASSATTSAPLRASSPLAAGIAGTLFRLVALPAGTERDGEAVFLDNEIPELVLQDDGHLLRILLMQPVGDAHARPVGVEGDIEVMVAGKAALSRLAQCLAHDPTQRLLDHAVISQPALGHRPWDSQPSSHFVFLATSDSLIGSGGHSVARRPPNRAYLLGSESQTLIVVGTSSVAR